MIRFTLLASMLLVAGCASARTSTLVASDSSDAFATSLANAPAVPASQVTSGDDDRAEPSGTLASEDPLSELGAKPAALAVAPAAGERRDSNIFTIKGGYYSSTEDGLDNGYIINASWMRDLDKLFGLELEVGYLDTDGSKSGVDTDVWAIPLMLNGRISVPIWVLDVYGGLGIGGFYYDINAKGAVSDSDNGFLFGGDAFLGGTVNLGDSLSIGLEGKYYLTDNISDFDTGLNAYAVMLTLGFNR